MTQIFLFFSNLYKHSCHNSGFPLLHGDVGLIASLLLCYSPSVWRTELSREDEALHTSDAKQTRIYAFLKLPETKDAVVERYVEPFLMSFRYSVAALTSVDSLTSESFPSSFCTVVSILHSLEN